MLSQGRAMKNQVSEKKAHARFAHTKHPIHHYNHSLVPFAWFLETKQKETGKGGVGSERSEQWALKAREHQRSPSAPLALHARSPFTPSLRSLTHSVPSPRARSLRCSHTPLRSVPSAPLSLQGAPFPSLRSGKYSHPSTHTLPQ